MPRSPARNSTAESHDVRVYSVALSASQVAETLRLDRAWKLSETSGTIGRRFHRIRQERHSDRHGKLVDRLRRHGVFDFNGSSNYISTTNASHLRPTSAMTIAAWIKGDSWSAGGDVDAIVRKGEGSPNNYQFAITDGRATLYLNDSDGAGFKGNTVLTTGTWYHVAAVWDGATVRIYVNGVLDNTPAARTGTIGTDTRPLYIGGHPGLDLFDGMIRDVTVI